MSSLRTGFVKIRTTPPYPLDTSMLGKDGVSLTSFVVNPYLEHLANAVREALGYFARRLQLSGVEIALDENSNEGFVQSDTRLQPSTSLPSVQPSSTPRDPQCIFDSSLTLPEAYSTPTAASNPSGVQSGVCVLSYLSCFVYLFRLHPFPIAYSPVIRQLLLLDPFVSWMPLPPLGR